MSRSLRYIAMSASPFPNELVPKMPRPEHGVHEQLEVVAGGGVAVEVDAAGRFQDAVQLNHALRHHGEVGHHVVLAEERAHRLYEVRELPRPVGHDILVGVLGLHAPVPGVVEGVNLGGGALAARLLEQDVVGGVGVEGRVEVDEVDALVRDVFPEDAEVVAEVELVLPVSHAVSRAWGVIGVHGSSRAGWRQRAGVATPSRRDLRRARGRGSPCQARG